MNRNARKPQAARWIRATFLSLLMLVSVWLGLPTMAQASGFSWELHRSGLLLADAGAVADPPAVVDESPTVESVTEDAEAAAEAAAKAEKKAAKEAKKLAKAEAKKAKEAAKEAAKAEEKQAKLAAKAEKKKAKELAKAEAQKETEAATDQGS